MNDLKIFMTLLIIHICEVEYKKAHGAEKNMPLLQLNLFENIFTSDASGYIPEIIRRKRYLKYNNTLKATIRRQLEHMIDDLKINSSLNLDDLFAMIHRPGHRNVRTIQQAIQHYAYLHNKVVPSNNTMNDHIVDVVPYWDPENRLNQRLMGDTTTITELCQHFDNIDFFKLESNS